MFPSKKLKNFEKSVFKHCFYSGTDIVLTFQKDNGKHLKKEKFKSLLILEPDKSLRKGLAVGLFDVFWEITSLSNPDEIINSSKQKNFSFIITGTAFENYNSNEIIKKLRIRYPLAKLFIISDKNDQKSIKELNELNPQKIYSNLFDLKELINDIKQIYDN